jgi:hypothetical protein
MLDRFDHAGLLHVIVVEDFLHGPAGMPRSRNSSRSSRWRRLGD